MHKCGVVLAGGKSSRMGRNKTILPIKNTPVIQLIADELEEVCEELIVIANDVEPYQFLNLNIYSDNYINKGPLAGIEAAMTNVDAELYLIVASDMPFINKEIYHYLLSFTDNYDAVIPVFNGHMHPLAGVYRKTTLPFIKQLLDDGNLKVRLLFDQIKVKYIDDFHTFNKSVVKKHFFNMNYPDEYEQAKQLTFDNETKKE